MAKELQLVVVTPETTLLDEPVSGLRFPLFDGQIGVLPDRAPLVGRLGCGELNVTTAAGAKSFFVDGGFVQITGATVTLLTARCVDAVDIDRDAATEDLKEAQARRANNDEAIEARFRDQERARKLLALTK
ncbi:MAG: FoF1 ATP synthase subunit delta/epsilon [Planctomycetota bacterium]|jgi:F-type H+-transporting ATPase subunit epsilon